jgi:AraC family transcriptional regulator
MFRRYGPLVALALIAAMLRGEAPRRYSAGTGETARLGRSGSIPEPPAGWLLAGIHLEDYAVTLDPQGGRSGGSALRVASSVPKPQGFAGVARQVDPVPYRGKRLALTAFARTKNVGGEAGLYLRIDTSGTPAWIMENMDDRPIRGTQAWRLYRIVLDVPENAVDMYYGALLEGTGTAWFDGFTLQEARPGEPTTSPEWAPLQFRGLDFETTPPG